MYWFSSPPTRQTYVLGKRIYILAYPYYHIVLYLPGHGEDGSLDQTSLLKVASTLCIKAIGNRSTGEDESCI
ncbi:hypothetical protein RIR_jg35685.t1 [Rhizophagus irregularis DAOM 181602=DAOM 197198]|nr:hypothetical protein RIR_jg35685.t1 [Rhizophagus irregularis DAOM 181602=DAOM 197198]